ncbi:MAG: rod shape-determining protein MreC [Candidatus Obscuribacterales bacterium]|nr:rod shape-determining protein MreC [Candidatus Obscuribacterales bacterium]
MPVEDGRASQSRFTVNSSTIAEAVFMAVLILMAAGPLSGMIAWTHSTLSATISRGATQVESTKNLAEQLMAASDKINGLEKKLADNELELTKLKQEAKDVNRLRSLLNLKQSITRSTIGADVTGRSPDNWFEQVIIDKGKTDGVKLGAAVITAQGVVGQIAQEPAESTSVVRLVTDPEQKLGVVIQRINMPGVLRGNYKNPPIIEFVPVGTPVDIGDKIVCAGDGGIFPQGHPIGTVSMVRRDTNGTTLSIEVKLADNLYDLTHVLIVPPISL